MRRAVARTTLRAGHRYESGPEVVMKAFRVRLRSGQEHILSARSYYHVRAGDSHEFVFVGSGGDGWRALRRFDSTDVAAITPIRPDAAERSVRVAA